MKALDLQVFEKHPGTEGIAGPVYRVGGSFTPYAIVGRDKRFSDAELCAEYWKLMSGLFDGHGKAAKFRRVTIERFAQLPHFDA